MKNFHLTPEQIIELRAAHKETQSKKQAYRIHAVILLGSDRTLNHVKENLFIDDETLRAYVNTYKEEGIAGLLNSKHSGKECLLSDEQQEILRHELDNNIHLTVNSVISFVKRTFQIEYSESGMRDLLHRLGYVYKKPKLVPGNPDIDEQEEFVKYYEEFMENKGENVEVFFMDAVHPEHNTMAAYGWIKKGESRELKTNSGRQRLNLHGAINAETHEITVIESDKVNSESTIDLLETIRQKYFLASVIYVILDNAKYHYSKEVREYLEGKNIKLAFLPPYSPNLNLIEGVWKFFKKNVLYNKYYKNLKDFRKACIKFFKSFSTYTEEISAIMNADFHIG